MVRRSGRFHLAQSCGKASLARDLARSSKHSTGYEAFPLDAVRFPLFFTCNQGLMALTLCGSSHALSVPFRSTFKSGDLQKLPRLRPLWKWSTLYRMSGLSYEQCAACFIFLDIAWTSAITCSSLSQRLSTRSRTGDAQRNQ